MWRNKSLLVRGKTPPNNIGPRSTPNYRSLVDKAIVEKDGLSIFAGQRDDAFYGDIGAIFDLLGFRKGIGQHGRRQGLLRRLRRAHDRTADPDLGSEGEEQHDRRLGLDRAPERHRRQEAPSRLDAGLPARQPARQRGRRADALQGPVEPLGARERQAVRRPRRQADPGEADERPLQAERTRGQP